MVTSSVACTVACTQADRDKKSDIQASFNVREVTGKGERGAVDPGAPWKIPYTVEFGFEACIEDRASRKEIPNQDFVVKVPGSRQVFPVKTNAWGCFQWDESIGYNHFAGESGWVTLEREIVGSGVYNGVRKVSILVNPWAVGSQARDSQSAVVFQRDGDRGWKPKKIYSYGKSVAAFAGELQKQARLLIQDIKVHAVPVSEKSDSVGSVYTIEMSPQAALLQRDGPGL
ncbi:MAG: hypothetical protein HC902_02550 [Calothrix sp. SM1_5_4]|nr:hypothetical protein [Calothrix sp. SM1_5_4]